MRLNSPIVTFMSNHSGGFTADVTAYRTRRDGTAEEVKLTFEDLTLYEVRCVAAGAITTMRNKRDAIQSRLAGLAAEAQR